MKDRSYANRGASFEQFLKFANDKYRQKGIALIFKQNTEFIPIRDSRGRLVSCKVETKATFDFGGRYKQYPIAIEAKNTNSDSIRFDAVQPNQADDMNDFCKQAGTIGIVVVSFNMRRFFAIPWQFWMAAYEVRVKRGNRTSPVSVKGFGQEWNVPCKFSVRADELNPAWEIPNHDYTYGIDYLKHAEQYVIENPNIRGLQPNNPENVV